MIKYILFGYFLIFSILILNIEFFLMDIIKMERKKRKQRKMPKINIKMTFPYIIFLPKIADNYTGYILFFQK